MGCVYFIITALLATMASSKPVMVSFGTNQGPIVPRPTTTTQVPRQVEDRRVPAPVSETSDDVPNPTVYRPLAPQQYRSRLLSFRPNPNLILGTAQDQKYLASSDKFSLLKRQQARAIGLDYRGPHYFETQQYELDKELQRQQQIPTAKQLFQPLMPYNSRRIEEPEDNGVPEIGVVYSSGVRYYVPQFGYYNDHRDSQENSINDKNDVNYYYYDTQANKNH